MACCYEARLRFVCPRRLTKIKTAKVHILDSCIITYHTKNYINVCNSINVNFPITGYFYNKWLCGVVVKKFERVEMQTQSPSVYSGYVLVPSLEKWEGCVSKDIWCELCAMATTFAHLLAVAHPWAQLKVLFQKSFDYSKSTNCYNTE